MGEMKWTLPFSRLKKIIILLLIIVYTTSAAKAEDCKTASHEDNTFTWADYLVLGSMLVVSCGIGVFYGFCGSKHESSHDFLLGGSSMGTFPMAMSLAASFVTAVELLGNPAEMYTHGSQFWAICLAFLMVVPITSKLYLPVFMQLRLTSSYEYFALRFAPGIRYLASALYILQMVLYTSVAVYAPALALSRVTGLNVYLAVTVVYIVCIFYASQGGMKAVIIADTFQAIVLIGSLIVIAYLGEKYIGGPAPLWSENFNTGRLELFNFDADFTIRHSFWSVVIGGTFYWLTMFCSNQASIQKYLSVETIGQVRKALWTSCFGLILVYTINFYTGMIMVAHYKDCDPLESGQIRASDEILPLYVITTLGHFKGMTGFFVAGIFAASLGTVASALNSLAAVTMQDFLHSAFKIDLPEAKGAFWAKIISIIYGAISFLLIFVVANLGSVMQVAISFNGMVGGVTLGLFSLGMFFPWANSKGAMFGSIIACALITLMCIGQQISIANGVYDEESKPTSIEHCVCLNTTLLYSNKPVIEHREKPLFLYRISYIWYSMIGFLVTVVLGMIGSFVTGYQDPKDVDADLISPPVMNFLMSLSNATKELLNLPLKPNNTKDVLALKVVQPKTVERIRKFSNPI
ncbi:unnamed protein product [Brassicogethes aeneus]|uniref:Sodium-coupled monocarboxylate transporter 1 n=1 Tax=Brassicogethes aeneus TaxID=1431903 RepID=A0A9P0B7Z4_BRAAE|nr:unnamed protein product [Brassicogethes aeneus]